MKYLTLAIMISGLILIFFSCSQDESVNSPPGQPPQLESVVCPGKMALNSDFFHQLQAVVSGETGGLQVRCLLRDSSPDTIGLFFLYDDAGALTVNDGLIYTSTYSGDVVAGDGIFTLGLNSLFTDAEINVEGVFLLLDAEMNLIASDTVLIQVYENQPPELTEPNAPDTLISGFTPFNLETTVTDPQGLQDIAEVKFALPSLNQEYQMSDPENDGNYTYYMAPQFAAGKYPGFYFFRFYAVDSLQAYSQFIDKFIYIENTMPELTVPSLYHPDITTYAGTADSLLIIPEPGDTMEVTITVNVSDLQTAEDIDEVYINIQRPTGNWTYNYPMADNGWEWDLENYMLGLPYLGDENAGDGIYTTTKLYTSAVDEGLHIFHFQAEDKAGQAADSIAVGLRFTH